MAFFGKKKQQEFDEEEIDEKEKLADRKLTRKFKDLNPENKKKRKEPIKPWGKKERLIVLGFFLTTTVAATAMFFYSHEFKFPGLPKISLNGISLTNPFSEKIIEIGQKRTVTDNDWKAETAIETFDKEIKPLPGVYGFVVIRLKSGDRYGVSSSSKFQGASLLKLPLMILMYRMKEHGNLNLDTEYALKEADKVKGAGVLSLKPAGTVLTYRKLAEYMGKESDRTAYKIMKDIIGESKLKDFLVESGLKETDPVNGVTTPNDLGSLMQMLWSGELVDNNDRDEILGFLTNTAYEKWITAGVPEGITVAHKFGQDAGVMADGGIILSDDPYVLVLMGNGITQHDADILFPKVSKNIYQIEKDDN